MISPGRSAIDQNDPEIGAPPRDHQAGHATATAQIDHGAGDAPEGGDERLAVIDDPGHRGGAEHAEALGICQRLDER